MRAKRTKLLEFRLEYAKKDELSFFRKPKQPPNAKLVVVGLGDMRDYLEGLVRNLHLEGVVKFRFEFIPEEERITYYAACDVAAFPSLYEPSESSP